MTLSSALLARSKKQCELCSGKTDLSVYWVEPVDLPDDEKSIVVCEICRPQLDLSADLDAHHWRCLGQAMWNELPAVQVVAWRLLKRLPEESWARDYLDQLFLEEIYFSWAEAGLSDKSSGESVRLTKDSNGTVLLDGDSVTLIKDLEVKGANFTAKRGTLVKNISLTSNPEHIEGKVNGTHIVLLTCFLKKAI